MANSITITNSISITITITITITSTICEYHTLKGGPPCPHTQKHPYEVNRTTRKATPQPVHISGCGSR